MPLTKKRMKNFILILLIFVFFRCAKDSSNDPCESCLISFNLNNVKYSEDGLYLGVGDAFDGDDVVNMDAGTIRIEAPNEYAQVCQDFIGLEVVLSLRATITSGLFEGVKTTIQYPHTFTQKEFENATCLD